MLELRLLGVPTLAGIPHGAGQSLLAQPKRFALLTYLSLPAPGSPHRRDQLLAMFWSELDQAHARTALRKILYHLRQALGGNGIIAADGDEVIALDPGAWCDVAAFRVAAGGGDWREALRLYQGDFLTGFHLPGVPDFEDWLVQQRADLRRLATDAAWVGAGEEVSAGRITEAVNEIRRAVRLNPGDETTVRRAIEALDRLGDRAAALDVYAEFVAWLKREFEASPSPETQALVEGVRAREDLRGDVHPRADRRDRRAGDVLPHGLRPRRRMWQWGTVAAVVSVIGGGAVLRSALGTGSLRPNRVFVAAFENRTGDPEVNPLGQIAADWITQGLAESGVVEIVTTGTALLVAQYEDSTDPVRTRLQRLARATGAGVIVWGSLGRAGDSIRYHAEIIQALEGTLLWTAEPHSVPLHSPMEGLPALRQRVTGALASLVDRRLEAWAAHATRLPTFEAYQQFILGLEALVSTRGGESRAEQYFARSAALDTSFLQPRLWLVSTLNNAGQREAADSLAHALDRITHQMTPYDRALLDYYRGWLHFDYELGAAALIRMLAIAPSLEHVVSCAFVTQVNCTLVTSRLNRPRQSLAMLARLNPDGGSLQDLAGMYWEHTALARHLLGDGDEEARAARRLREFAMRRGERSRWARPLLQVEGRALAARGRIGDVERLIEQDVVVAPHDADSYGDLGYMMMDVAREFRTHGYPVEAERIFDRAVRWLRDAPPAWRNHYWEFVSARVLTEAGRWRETDSVLASLRPANDVESYWILGMRGVVSARLGQRARARQMEAELLGLEVPHYRNRSVTWSYLPARIEAALGNRERAIEFLRRGMTMGLPMEWVHNQFPSLHGFPPFEEFVRPKG